MPMSAEEIVQPEHSFETPSNRVADVVRNPRGLQTLGQLVDDNGDRVKADKPIRGGPLSD